MTTMTLTSTISFRDLFPFHFELDESLAVKSCGPVLLKIEQEILGKSFNQLFSFAKPLNISNISFEKLKENLNTLVSIEELSTKNSYKGQFIYQQATNTIFFIHTPCLITVTETTTNASIHSEMKMNQIFDSLLSKKSLLDLSRLTNLFINNEDNIQKMLQLFVDTSPEINSRLQKAIDNENMTEIKNLSHQLRPSLEYIASPELSALALEIQYMEVFNRFYYEKAFALYLLLVELVNELKIKLKLPK